MMLPFAFLLAVGLSLVEISGTQVVPANWTYHLKCYDCTIYNSFNCANVRVCPYDIRRCMTIAIRIHTRELLVFKNCTWNCTFLYTAMQPAEAPRAKQMKINSFYFHRCCSSMTCNAGGPTNVEKDILEDTTIEEELSLSVLLKVPNLFLSFASLIVSNTLTGENPLGGSIHLPFLLNAVLLFVTFL